MVASADSPEDVVNLALVRLGYPSTIGSIYEGSKAAVAALNIYAATRDELLRTSDFDFSEATVALTLLKSAPDGGYVGANVWDPAQHPPFPWLFSYIYPDDCLRVRSVKPQGIFTTNFAPRPHVFGIQNDNSGPTPAKVLVSNVPSALMVYTRRVTDPSLWESDFVDALAAALARRLGAVLVSKDAAQVEAQDEGASRANAARQEG